MKQVFCIFAAAVIALAVGCVPERVVWSPDGSRALILGDDGLHLCDLNGKLSAPVAPSTGCAAWMPDGKRVIASMTLSLESWAEVSNTFPQDADVAAKNIDATRAELLTYKDSWSTFPANASQKLNLSQNQLIMALMKLREDDGPSLAAKLNRDMRDNFLNARIDEFVAQTFTAGDGTLTPGQVLYRRIQEGEDVGKVHALRISPTGSLVALTVSQNDNNDGKPDGLLIISTDGSDNTIDLGMAAAYPDWSTDGKYVVYIRPANWHKEDKDISVAMLSRRQVVDDKGALVDTQHLPPAEDLAGMTFDGWGRVRVARDGRIFFSTTELSLPVTGSDVPTQGTIFYFDPGRSSTLTRVVPRGLVETLGNSPNYFELSPDARYVSIPFNDGRVTVLDIAKGDAKVVQAVAEGNGKDLKLQSVPSWRTATELTFIQPTADLRRHEIVRYSLNDDSKTALSAAWPQGTLDVLTKPLEPATQPSTGGK